MSFEPTQHPPEGGQSTAEGGQSTAEGGQSTAEYALILVAVTVMVGVVIAYVSGDGGGMITALFGAAFAKMRALVGG